jgi:hypothetical protein
MRGFERLHLNGNVVHLALQNSFASQFGSFMILTYSLAEEFCLVRLPWDPLMSWGISIPHGSIFISAESLGHCASFKYLMATIDIATKRS